MVRPNYAFEVRQAANQGGYFSSLVGQPDSWSQPLNPIDTKLYAWACELCQEFDLEYIDAAELMAWKVDPDILTEEMLFRMDYTDDPNAFQLLFHE
jgi:hypothetical protein